MQPSGTVLPSPPFARLMVSFTGTAGGGGTAAGSGRYRIGDNALAHEGPGRVVDRHQSAVGSGHTAAGALGAGRAALHQPHRLFAAGSGPLGILTGRAGHDHQLVHLRTLVKGPDAPLQDGLTAPDRSSVYQIPSGWKNQPPPGLPSHDIPISYTCPILFLPCAALHRAYYYSLNIIAYPPTNCNSPRPSKMPPCNTFGAVRGHKFFMKFLRYARMGSMAAARASF